MKQTGFVLLAVALAKAQEIILPDLLRPIPVTKFFEDSWEHDVTHIKGVPGRFSKLALRSGAGLWGNARH